MEQEPTEVAVTEPNYLESQEEFESYIDESEVLIVDFFAGWCGPCKMMDPVLETIAADTPASVLKVDVDDHQSLAAEHDVRGVPTIKVYANGEPVNRLVGYQDESTLRKVVTNLAE